MAIAIVVLVVIDQLRGQFTAHDCRAIASLSLTHSQLDPITKFVQDKAYSSAQQCT
jgi:hypothetical protein